MQIFELTEEEFKYLSATGIKADTYFHLENHYSCSLINGEENTNHVRAILKSHVIFLLIKQLIDWIVVKSDRIRLL